LTALAEAFVEAAFALDAEDKIQNALGTLPYFTKHIPQQQRLSLVQAAKAPRSLNYDPDQEMADQASNRGGKLTMDEAGGFLNYT
jgi:hypothetical protein